MCRPKLVSGLANTMETPTPKDIHFASKSLSYYFHISENFDTIIWKYIHFKLYTWGYVSTMAKHLSCLNGGFASMVIVKHCTIYISDMNCKRKCEDLISRTMTLWKGMLHLTTFFYASCNPRHNHVSNLTKIDEQIQELWRRTLIYVKIV